jgi:hypothetical protein
MTSIGFGDIIPLTDVEKLFAVIIMIVGASTYGGIFGAFVVIIDDLKAEERELRSKLEETKQWVQLRHIRDALRARIYSYFATISQSYNYIQKYDLINSLPLSLKTELSMHFHEDLIQNVKLFELGDASFILSMVRSLKPKVYMAEDYVTR